MLIDILKESLRLMKKNLNLSQLIFIFFIIITLVLPFIIGMKMNVKLIPTIIIFYALLCAFYAGLFFAFKKSMDYEENPPESDDPLFTSPLYFAEFFQGVGKYFSKYISAGLLVIALLIIFAIGFHYIVSHYIVIPQKFIDVAKSDILTSDTKIMQFVNSLTLAEQMLMAKISMLTLAFAFVFGLITLMYPVILVEREENFAKSYLTSLKYLFKNFPIIFMIFLLFNFGLGILSLLGASAANNLIISVVVIILQCYINVWYILSLFVYYEKVKECN